MLSVVIALMRSLFRQMFPTGRAFKMPFDGVFDRLMKALADSFAQAYLDAMSILNVILPDNSDFTADDATDWERRLGISSSSAVPLSTRKAAIIRKMNHPGTAIYRQSAVYLEAQLQAAGFSVYVYENKFSDGMGGFITKTPSQVMGSYISGYAMHGAGVHGGMVHGSYGHKIVNYISENRDAVFISDPDYKSTFFIAGATITTVATVPAARKNEFRQLILQIKPLQSVGFLFVNYT